MEHERWMNKGVSHGKALVIDKSTGEVIACVEPWIVGIHDDQAIQTARANLIAAAPELLEACARIIARAESGSERDHFSETFDVDFDFARAAIAKAEGDACSR